MRTSLRARRKWGFIEGSIEKTKPESSELEDWWTVQSMLISWIMNTIEPSLRSIVTYIETAKELWDNLKEQLSVVNGPRIQQLKSELAHCKQRGMSIVNYYGKLKSLWDELAIYEPILAFTCKGCECEIIQKLHKRREEEHVHQFLMGLKDAVFGTTRSNLPATDPFPPLNRAYATMVQEERVKTIVRAAEERREVVALAAHTNFKGKGQDQNKDKNLACSHCNRGGHDSSTCFKIIGYL